MIARHLLAPTVVASLLAVAGCTTPGTGLEPVDGDCYADPAGCTDAEAARHRFVVDSVRMPTTAVEARALGLDIDADERPENALGSILTAIDNLSDFQLQTVLDEAIADGTLILLVDVHADDLMSATGAGGRMLFGAQPSPAPCNGTLDKQCGRHLDGSGSFAIDDSTVIDAALSGEIVSGLFVGGPARITTDVFLDGVLPAPVTVDGIGVRAEVTTAEEGRLRGIIGGAVTPAHALDVVLPVITELAVADCTATDATCCLPDSVGEALVQFFDTDGDCYLGYDELAANDTIQTVFAPDVDLLDADGQFRPGSDGVPDSISLGAEFTAIRATFD